jgi:hypothetical protein
MSLMKNLVAIKTDGVKSAIETPLKRGASYKGSLEDSNKDNGKIEEEANEEEEGKQIGIGGVDKEEVDPKKKKKRIVDCRDAQT